MKIKIYHIARAELKIPTPKIHHLSRAQLEEFMTKPEQEDS